MSGASHNCEGIVHLELEVPCSHCDGEGTVDDCREETPCPFCEGAGFEPTELGRTILALIRHNFVALLDDAENDEM